MRSFTLRGLTLYLPEAALKGNLERSLTAGRYENHEADALLMHLRPGDRFLDLGAGIGFICALVAGVLGEDAVFGVEAGPETIKLARRNLAANGFQGVKLMRGAVLGTGAGEVEFGQRPAFWASGLKGPEGWPENADVIRVPARSIAGLEPRARARGASLGWPARSRRAASRSGRAGQHGPDGLGAGSGAACAASNQAITTAPDPRVAPLARRAPCQRRPRRGSRGSARRRTTGSTR